MYLLSNEFDCWNTRCDRLPACHYKLIVPRIETTRSADWGGPGSRTPQSRTRCLPLLHGIRGATMTQQPPSPGFKTIAPRMSTALGETAQPQAAIGSECVQTMCREEPRIAREGAAPERPKVHDWKSCVRATVPRVRTGVECSTQWKIPRRTTVLAQQATRVVHPSLSALERSRC